MYMFIELIILGHVYSLNVLKKGDCTGWGSLSLVVVRCMKGSSSSGGGVGHQESSPCQVDSHMVLLWKSYCIAHVCKFELYCLDGEFLDGKPHGRGVMKSARSGWSYEGNFERSSSKTPNDYLLCSWKIRKELYKMW